MPLCDVIGDVCETRGEVRVEWQIHEFFSLSCDVDSFFASPIFCLSDSCWRLHVYPKGTKDLRDYIGLYVSREDCGPPKNVTVSLGIKKTDGVEEKCKSTVKVPDETRARRRGLPKFISSVDLQRLKDQYVPSGVFTVTCSVSCVDPFSTEVSMTSRLWNLSSNLKTILDEKSETDFTIELKDGELYAHRLILEGRCDYFGKMLNNNFEEKEKGVVCMNDIEKEVFKCILSYLYTGEVHGVSYENVSKIYVAADKLLLVELKKFCVYYMRENLNLNLISDVIAIVEKYDEKELEDQAMEYFTRHADEIFESDGWKKFKAENEAMTPEFLEKIIVMRMKLLKA